MYIYAVPNEAMPIPPSRAKRLSAHGKALLMGGFTSPLVGSKTSEDLMRQNEGHGTSPGITSPVVGARSSDVLGWYVRVNGVKVFGPFARQRFDAFVNARRSRSGTKTEVRRGSKGVWHSIVRLTPHTLEASTHPTHTQKHMYTQKKSMDAPTFSRKRGSAYNEWRPKTKRAEAATTTTVNETQKTETMKRRLSKINRVRRKRMESERMSRENEEDRVAAERRAGATFLSRLYNVPEDNILPRSSSHDFS